MPKMQKLKTKFFGKFQTENKMGTVKSLSKNPVIQSSVAAVILMTIISWLNIKPLGLIFWVIFCFWFFKNRCNIHIQASPELKKYFELMEQRVVKFKENKPTMFCAVASSCLGCLAIIGHFVSGSIVVLIGLIFAAIISAKYNFKILKIDSKDYTYSEKLQQHEYEYEQDEEFMPEVNESNMSVLERASDLASLTSPTEDGDNDEDKSDEVPSELLIPDCIPEIDESSTDDDEDDLLPIIPVSNSAIESSDNYLKSDDTVEFKKSHFKRDSSLSTTSSSSEESLSKGLQFPDHTAVDGPSKSRNETTSNTVDIPISSSQQVANDLVTLAVTSQTQYFLANSSKLIPTLMTSLAQGVFGIGTRAIATQSSSNQASTHYRLMAPLDSSEDSDFEILEKEDFQ